MTRRSEGRRRGDGGGFGGGSRRGGLIPDQLAERSAHPSCFGGGKLQLVPELAVLIFFGT